MKRVILLITLCALPFLVFSQVSNIDISKMVINSFQKREFSKIVEPFDQTMKAALPVDKLKTVWDDLNSKCGKYQKYTEITTATIQGYDVVYILCHFEKMNLKLKTVFNSKREIAGLFFIPENQN